MASGSRETKGREDSDLLRQGTGAGEFDLGSALTRPRPRQKELADARGLPSELERGARRAQHEMQTRGVRVFSAFWNARECEGVRGDARKCVCVGVRGGALGSGLG
jgi:hypothetical protein